MGKISPVSIKYMIHANLVAEGALEKPDVIGAVFGQTEGLLGAELEMRELQKEGKIGRIEVDIERKDRHTYGKIRVPTALDQSETTLIAAAIETIERVGPCDAQIEVEQIEDVRGSKRDYIIERAKKLMQEIRGTTDSREISKEIKYSTKTIEVQEHGASKLPSGDLSGKEIIVVEGRADVLNLLRHGIPNVVAMNGTKLPDEIKELGKSKEITLFIDGDRGGHLIVRNVHDNANIAYVAIAPDGKEVEELAKKEVLISLRKKIPVKEFISKNGDKPRIQSREEIKKPTEKQKEDIKEISKKYEGTGKAVLLDQDLKEIRTISPRGVSSILMKMDQKPFAIIIDGTVTGAMINSAERVRSQVIVAKNFSTTDTSLTLLSF